MARAVAEFEKEIRTLEPDDQEHLLQALLEKLDGPAIPMSSEHGLQKRSSAARNLTQVL
jgi:hypothetical protein